MSKAETEYHLNIKERIKTKLEEWYQGITIKEYPSQGQEADAYHISYSGLSILVEVIWTDTWNQFLRDMDILKNSVDFIKIPIVNPTIFKKYEKKLTRHFDKMRSLLVIVIVIIY